MEETFLSVNNIPTHIMTWGGSVEESLKEKKEIVLCITGNPGLPGFYTRFLSTVYNQLDQNIPVWVIGHAGHDEPSPSSIKQVPPLVGNEQLFDLQGQVKHKIEFIEKYIPADCKIHLIGHSIGSWIILELLKQPQIKSKVKKCYMLFPTVERMEETSNGWIFTRATPPLTPIVRILLLIFHLLPLSIRTFLVYIYCWLSSTPNHFIRTILMFLRISVLEKIIFLAKDEMAKVRELDVDSVKNNKELLKFYYGTTDGWVPVKYFYQIKAKIPNLDAKLDDKRISHAFVLRSWYEMGIIVTNWIKEYGLKEY